MKRKSELYDPECPDSDDDSESDDQSAGEENSDRSPKKKEEEKPIEPAAKIQKVPIKLAIPTTIGGKRPDDAKSSDQNDKQPSNSNKNGTQSSSTSVRFRFRFSHDIQKMR